MFILTNFSVPYNNPRVFTFPRTAEEVETRLTPRQSRLKLLAKTTDSNKALKVEKRSLRLK
jgi:hypothetical protein